MRVKYPHWCFIFLHTFAKKKEKTKKQWNRGKLQNTWPLVVLIFNNWSILYFSDSPFKLLQQRLKASGQGFCSCFMKCCWQSVSQVMVQCLYCCDVLCTNWKYKWPNICFTFSPAIIDSLIDYTQLFTVPSIFIDSHLELLQEKKLYTVFIHL